MWQIGIFVLIGILGFYTSHTMAGRMMTALALVMLIVAVHYYIENKRMERERDAERNRGNK